MAGLCDGGYTPPGAPPGECAGKGEGVLGLSWGPGGRGNPGGKPRGDSRDPGGKGGCCPPCGHPGSEGCCSLKHNAQTNYRLQ